MKLPVMGLSMIFFVPRRLGLDPIPPQSGRIRVCTYKGSFASSCRSHSSLFRVSESEYFAYDGTFQFLRVPCRTNRSLRCTTFDVQRFSESRHRIFCCG